MVQDDSSGRILYQDETHTFIWLGSDTEKKQGVVQTNQYLIIEGGKGVLLDPGGVHLFSRVVASISRYINLENIETIFFSHQDPDVSSGIALWLGVTGARIFVSGLWVRFLPHFGIVDVNRIIEIEKAGGAIQLRSGSRLQFVPAHFLHSAGNYCLFDERARILFSADIGTAVFPENSDEYLFVEDFNAHLSLMKPFHQRYMAGNKVLRAWVERVTQLNPNMIAPQHGAVFGKEASVKLLAWLRDLECGTDLLDTLYR